MRIYGMYNSLCCGFRFIVWRGWCGFRSAGTKVLASSYAEVQIIRDFLRRNSSIKHNDKLHQCLLNTVVFITAIIPTDGLTLLMSNKCPTCWTQHGKSTSSWNADVVQKGPEDCKACSIHDLHRTDFMLSFVLESFTWKIFMWRKCELQPKRLAPGVTIDLNKLG